MKVHMYELIIQDQTEVSPDKKKKKKKKKNFLTLFCIEVIFESLKMFS